MSFEYAVDGVARAMKLVPGMRGVYASNSTGQTGVEFVPTDIPATPSCIVRHNGFRVASRGYEVLIHDVVVDLYLNASEPGGAEKQLMSTMSGIFNVMRTNVGLFGLTGITMAMITVGGPPDDTNVNGKDFVVYPIHVEVTAAGPQTYSLT